MTRVIPIEFLYIAIGALFSAVATLSLNTYQVHKRANETRRAVLAEMESMEALLQFLATE